MWDNKLSGEDKTIRHIIEVQGLIEPKEDRQSYTIQLKGKLYNKLNRKERIMWGTKENQGWLLDMIEPYND